MPFNHLDLFSGIGGFALAASWVWGNEHNITSFVEIDPFCQKVLRKHWPDVPIISDIRDVTYERTNATIDLLTAGVPCQAASCAGKQRGTEDNRWLWPQAFRVVREVRPTWCIFENVKGLLALEQGVVFESLLLELEDIGYETETYIIPACGVDAPHRRDRVWIVAHSNGERQQKQRICLSTGNEKESDAIAWGGQDVADNDRPRLQNRKSLKAVADKWPPINGSCGRRWLPEPSVCELDDGLSDGLVRYRGRVATGVRDRVNKLKALGNSVVPQVVVPIMQAIKEIEDKGGQS